MLFMHVSTDYSKIILKNILKPVLFEVLELQTNSEGVWLQDGESYWAFQANLGICP